MPEQLAPKRRLVFPIHGTPRGKRGDRYQDVQPPHDLPRRPMQRGSQLLRSGPGRPGRTVLRRRPFHEQFRLIAAAIASILPTPIFIDLQSTKENDAFCERRIL
jgi:hypothetical protein